MGPNPHADIWMKGESLRHGLGMLKKMNVVEKSENGSMSLTLILEQPEALELIEGLAILLQSPSAEPVILSSGNKGITVYIQVEK
jgi:hypothetical protein